MQSFTKKTLVVFMVAMLLASVVLLPGISSADERSNTPSAMTWQTDPNVVRTYNAQTGALNYVSFPPQVRSQYNFKAGSSSDALTTLNGFSAEFGLTELDKDLKATKTFKAVSGSTSYRFQQQVDGVPVFNGELLLNYDQDGFLTAISGETADKSAVRTTTPRIDSATATANALNAVAEATGLPMSMLKASAPELWILDPSLYGPYAGVIELTWRMEITAINGGPIRYDVFASAEKGSVPFAYNDIDTAWGEAAAERGIVANSPVAPLTPRAWAPNFNGHSITYDSNSTPDRQGTGASTLACNDTQPTTNTQFGATACDGVGANPITAATAENAAQFFSFDTWDYFDFYFNRNSLDDAGMTLISNVNYRQNIATPYANAFWDGEQMTYGDSGFWPADDVVTHEMGHGLTDFVSNLTYYFESGAINESMSDVFGEFADYLNGVSTLDGSADGVAVVTDPNAWLMGEDLTIGAIRNMANPPAFGDPDRMLSPVYFAPSLINLGVSGQGADSGGVHINSGVSNKAAYLMAVGGTFNGQTITPLGTTTEDSVELASVIYYETQFLLTGGSDYAVLDQALVTACTSLIGVAVPGTTDMLDAADCTEVSQVTDATEMHLDPVSADWQPHAEIGCTDPLDTPVNLFTEGFESGTVFGPPPASMTAVNVSGQSHSGNWVVYTYSSEGDQSLDMWNNLAADNYLRMTSSVALTGGIEYFLYFDHAYGMLNNPVTTYNDAGVVEYSTDGTNWFDLDPMFVDGRDYTGVVNVATSLQGRNAFVADSHGYVSTRYNLSSLWGQNVNIRWRMANDGNAGTDWGWELDNIILYACTDTGPTNTITPTASLTPSITPTTCAISVTPPSLSSPSHRTHTTDTTPSFSWSQVSGAQSYRLMVYTEDRSFEFKKRRVGQTSTSYTLSAAEALTPQKYLWRVRTQDLGCGTWTKWSQRNTLFVD